MICGKCGEEVITQPGKSVNFCPNCGSRMEEEKSSNWKTFDNTKELLSHIAAEYGQSVLFDNRLLRSYLSDHASSSLPQRQRSLVGQSAVCGAVKILEDNLTSDPAHKEIASKQAVQKMVDTYSTAKDAAERIVWEFTNALGWGLPEPQTAVQPTSAIISAPQVGATTSTPSTPPSGDIGKLMTLGWQSADVGDWEDARDYFIKAREADPTYSPAFLGLICVDLKCPQEDKLAKIKDPGSITNHKYFKLATSDPAVSARVSGYIQTINARIAAEQKAAAAEAERNRKAAKEAARRMRVQVAFDSACKIMGSAQGPDDYRKVIAAFGSIDSNYQDINNKIKGKVAQCEQLLKVKEEEQKAAKEAARRMRVQVAFDNACKIMGSAQGPDDYRKAITAFWNIDSSYQDINSQIKGKVAECEKKMQQMTAELDRVLAPLREKFDPKAKAEKQAKLQEQRRADKERLDAENAKTKNDVEAKCSQIQQKHDADHKVWQEEYNRLKAAYDMEYKKWETEANAVKTQTESRKSQGVCQHCGGTLKGLLSKKCADCGKSPSEPVTSPTAPTTPNYPAEPRLPQMPTFTPRALDESKYTLREDTTSVINQRITLAGIEWRILDIRDGKLLLISEKILEKRPYNVEQKDITWENCTLRKYLNGEFLNKIGAIKSAIAETRNITPNNPWGGTGGDSATTDKVFLLSLDELVKYFGDSGDLANKRRKDYTGKPDSSGYYLHDQYNNARIANYGSEGASWWWLRSPGDGSGNAADFNIDGDVYVFGLYVNFDSGGVRPALWLNL